MFAFVFAFVLLCLHLKEIELPVTYFPFRCFWNNMAEQHQPKMDIHLGFFLFTFLLWYFYFYVSEIFFSSVNMQGSFIRCGWISLKGTQAKLWKFGKNYLFKEYHLQWEQSPYFLFFLKNINITITSLKRFIGNKERSLLTHKNIYFGAKRFFPSLFILCNKSLFSERQLRVVMLHLLALLLHHMLKKEIM